MKLKEFGFLHDIQKYGLKVALWNRSFLFCSWLMRIQGATGIKVRGGSKHG